MKKHNQRSLSLRTETIRTLTDLHGVSGGARWTTRTSDGLPCTNEPTSTQTCPPPPTVTK